MRFIINYLELQFRVKSTISMALRSCNEYWVHFINVVKTHAKEDVGKTQCRDPTLQNMTQYAQMNEFDWIATYTTPSELAIVRGASTYLGYVKSRGAAVAFGCLPLPTELN